MGGAGEISFDAFWQQSWNPCAVDSTGDNWPGEYTAMEA
jgi:hypothetical protein